MMTRQRKKYENDEENLTGYKETDKIDNKDRVDNNRSCEIYQIQKTIKSNEFRIIRN